MGDPEDIAPNETSLFSVGGSRWHAVCVDNVICDCRHAIALYGGAHDSVADRNDAKRAGVIEAEKQKSGRQISRRKRTEKMKRLVAAVL